MTKKNDMLSLPEDLQEQIILSFFESPSTTVKMMQTFNKSKKEHSHIIQNMLSVQCRKLTNSFCELKKINNILPIVKCSLFDYEQLNTVLNNIDELRKKRSVKLTNEKNRELIQQISNNLTFDIKKKVSLECNNSTFCIFQFIKFYTIKSDTSYLVEDVVGFVDSCLFDFFEKVYNSNKSVVSKTLNQDSITIPDYTDDVLDNNWYNVCFNLYFIYNIQQMYKEQKRVSITIFNSLIKYLKPYSQALEDPSNIEYTLDELYVDIKFVVNSESSLQEQNQTPHYSLIFAYILFQLLKNNEQWKTESMLKTNERRLSIGDICQMFKNKLNEIEIKSIQTQCRQILDIAPCQQNEDLQYLIDMHNIDSYVNV